MSVKRTLQKLTVDIDMEKMMKKALPHNNKNNYNINWKRQDKVIKRTMCLWDPKIKLRAQDKDSTKVYYMSKERELLMVSKIKKNEWQTKS